MIAGALILTNTFFKFLSTSVFNSKVPTEIMNKSKKNNIQIRFHYNIYDNNQTKATSEIIKEILIFFFLPSFVFFLIYIYSSILKNIIYFGQFSSGLCCGLKV